MKLNVDYKAHYFGAHDAVAVNVQNRNVDAGGLSKPIFETLVDRGIIDMNKIRVLLVSKAYPNYPWTMRTNMKPELIKKIKDAFYNVKDKEIMKYFKAEGFGAVTHKDYEIVEKTGLALGLIRR